MTRDEVKKFVKHTIDATWGVSWMRPDHDRAIEHIVDRWMSDIATTNDEAWQRGTNQAQEA